MPYIMALSGLLLISSISLAVADPDPVWDYAPNFASDPIPPYPDLKNPDGTNISVDSLRGVHLFGWKGCTNEEANEIATAYNDFYTLAQQPAVYNNIDWTSPAATDFWGPASGPNAVPADTRKEIQRESARTFNNGLVMFEASWLTLYQRYLLRHNKFTHTRGGGSHHGSHGDTSGLK